MQIRQNALDQVLTAIEFWKYRDIGGQDWLDFFFPKHNNVQ